MTQSKKTKTKKFVGKWIIVEMEAWDQDYVNIEVDGHFTFNKNGTGHFQFGLVRGEMDYRIETIDELERIAFSWEGQDELDPASGRGWVMIQDTELHGRVFFHQGDDSTFRATRS